jgi:nitrogen fixation/metabolism regulation signal transduction histidine kinase
MKLQRRRYVTHKKFQFRMLVALLLLVLLATLATTLVNHYFFLSSIVNYTVEYESVPSGRDLWVASLQPLIIILPVVFVILAAIVIFISHKIAGPLYRLKQYMEKVENGDLSVQLKFRQGDAIHDIAESFNRMVEGIRTRYRRTEEK